MNWADWAILGILLVSCLISLKRGFIKEALSLATWVAAFIVAMLFGAKLSNLLVDTIATPSVREITAFAILFATTLVVGAMVNYLIGELVRMTGLSGTDRLFGVIFGFVRGTIVVLALVLMLPSILSVDQDVWWQESRLIPHFLMMEDWARKTASDVTDYVVGLF